MLWQMGRLGLRFRQTAGRWILRILYPALYLAAFLWRRLLFRTTFVAVTGSLGKTTAKESLACLLRSRHRTFVSLREQNGGVLPALNLLRVRPWHQIAVFELAAIRSGDLAPRSRMLRPDLAVLLTVARTHTMNYRSLEDIAEEKWTILAGMKPGATVLLNGDDPLLANRGLPAGIRRLTFGTSASCHFMARDVQAAWPDRLSFTVHHAGACEPVRTRLVGAHFVTSALGAIAASVELGLTLREAAAGAAGLTAFPGRMQPLRLPSGAIVIRDEINGSVDSLQPALRFLANARASRRIFVTAGFSDSKEKTSRRMAKLAREAAEVCEMVVFFGDGSGSAARSAIRSGMPEQNVKQFFSLPPLADFLREELRPGDLVVIRGRGTDHLSRVVLSQFGQLGCWEPSCRLTITCDFCWKLGLSKDIRERLISC